MIIPLVSIRPTDATKTGRIGYMGEGLYVADQAMYTLFNEDR